MGWVLDRRPPGVEMQRAPWHGSKRQLGAATPPPAAAFQPPPAPPPRAHLSLDAAPARQALSPAASASASAPTAPSFWWQRASASHTSTRSRWWPCVWRNPCSCSTPGRLARGAVDQAPVCRPGSRCSAMQRQEGSGQHPAGSGGVSGAPAGTHHQRGTSLRSTHRRQQHGLGLVEVVKVGEQQGAELQARLRHHRRQLAAVGGDGRQALDRLRVRALRLKVGGQAEQHAVVRLHGCAAGLRVRERRAVCERASGGRRHGAAARSGRHGGAGGRRGTAAG